MSRVCELLKTLKILPNSMIQKTFALKIFEFFGGIPWLILIGV